MNAFFKDYTKMMYTVELYCNNITMAMLVVNYLFGDAPTFLINTGFLKNTTTTLSLQYQRHYFTYSQF